MISWLVIVLSVLSSHDSSSLLDIPVYTSVCASVKPSDRWSIYLCRFLVSLVFARYCKTPLCFWLRLLPSPSVLLHLWFLVPDFWFYITILIFGFVWYFAISDWLTTPALIIKDYDFGTFPSASGSLPDLSQFCLSAFWWVFCNLVIWVLSGCLYVIWARAQSESTSALFGYFRDSGVYIELASPLVFWKFPTVALFA